jgi:hypothetical protein
MVGDTKYIVHNYYMGILFNWYFRIKLSNWNIN